VRSALNTDERLGFTERARRPMSNLQGACRYLSTPKPTTQWYSRFWKIFADTAKINTRAEAGGKIGA